MQARRSHTRVSSYTHTHREYICESKVHGRFKKLAQLLQKDVAPLPRGGREPDDLDGPDGPDRDGIPMANGEQRRCCRPAYLSTTKSVSRPARFLDDARRIGGGGASSAGPGPHAPSSPSLPPPPPPQRHVLRSIGRPSGRKTHHGVSGSRARIWRAEPLRGVAGPFRHGGVQTRARRLPFSSTRVPVDPSPQCIFFPPPSSPSLPRSRYPRICFLYFSRRRDAIARKSTRSRVLT